MFAADVPPNIEVDGASRGAVCGLLSSFCTSIGMSLSPAPESSSYLHLFLNGVTASDPDDLGLSSLPLSWPSILASSPPVAPFESPPPGAAASIAPAVPGNGGSGTVCARDHSTLVLASKNPEHRVRVCRCSR